MAKRKISYNYILFRKGDVEIPIESPLSTIIDYISSKNNLERKYDLTNDKFSFVSTIYREQTSDSTIFKILFKSAKHSYRAPLLDKVTVASRENPKTMNEGEQVKTHLLIKITGDDAYLFLETGNNLLTCKNIVEYLNHILSSYNNECDNNSKIEGKFEHAQVPDDNFENLLRNMDRVTAAEMYVDNKVLGSEFLGFSNPTEVIKKDVKITVSADRLKNMFTHAYDFLQKFRHQNSEIKRIRVKGKSVNGNESIIDTSFLVKKEYIIVEQDAETGEFETQSVFLELSRIAENY